MIDGIKRNVVLAVLAAGIVACSSSPFNEQSRLPLEGYEEQVYAACMQSNTYREKGEDAKTTVCRNHAQHNVSNAQTMFELYQKDNVMKKCADNPEFNNCAKEYQRSFYDQSFKELIEKRYPITKEK